MMTARHHSIIPAQAGIQSGVHSGFVRGSGLLRSQEHGKGSPVMTARHHSIIPAQAGIQGGVHSGCVLRPWAPAVAGALEVTCD